MKKIPALAEAREKGEKYYFTGEPCKRGHIDVRFVINRQCKACSSLQNRKAYQNNKNYYSLWRHRNPIKCQEADIKRKFKITLSDVAQMIENQNGLCLICDVELKNLVKRDVTVDHCHDTLKVRGILCRKCNAGLGMFEDDCNRMKRAIGYIEGSLAERILGTMIDKSHTIHETLDRR